MYCLLGAKVPGDGIVLLSSEFLCKLINLFRNFSFYGVRMRTCYARPEIVYILSREDRLILR